MRTSLPTDADLQQSRQKLEAVKDAERRQAQADLELANSLLVWIATVQLGQHWTDGSRVLGHRLIKSLLADLKVEEDDQVPEPEHIWQAVTEEIARRSVQPHKIKSMEVHKVWHVAEELARQAKSEQPAPTVPVDSHQAHRLEQYDSLVVKARALFAERNAEYGDAFAGDGLLGTLLEQLTVAARLRQMQHTMLRQYYAEGGIHQALLNQIADKLADALNYAVLGMICLDDRNYLGKD